ncbi:MAG: LuxR C-terminal-related transcriptional regulator [Lachnospiraceae bacterium]
MAKKIMDTDSFRIKDGIYLSDRLKKALMASLEKSATVVEAPTGYGKTVAVREFCRNVELPVKWINIYDNDPFHAWGTLCRELFSNSTVVQRFLKWPFPLEGMQRDRFADEFEKILTDEPVVIVLDDFHQIQSDQVSDFLYYFVKEFVDRIHLIIISQKTVFKDEKLLVATGKLNKIHTEDLRMSRDDFFNYVHMQQLEINVDDLEQIYEKSEGWISMIYVSVLNYIRVGKSDLSADMEHLVDRVAYATCSKQTQHFLSYLALLPDFTKEQADFFNGGEDSEPMLRELIENHSFFGQDPNTGKYHLHTIFKNCIYHHFERLSLSERCIRYERLAEYLVQEGNYHEALRWYEKAGNYEGILRTLELFETICSREEDRELIIRCYDDCPRILFEDYPLCLVLFMWRFYNYGEESRLSECRQLFEQLMEQIKLAKEDMDYLWKAYYVFLSQSAFNDLDQMRYYMQKAVALPGDDLPKIDSDVPRTFGIPSVFHMFYLGGSGREVVDKLRVQLNEYREHGICVYDGVESLAEAEYQYYVGDFEQAEILCHKALRRCQTSGLTCYMVNIQYLNAHLAYMRGDFEEIKRILDEMRSMVIRERSEHSSLTYTVDMCEAFFHEYIGYPVHMADWIREGSVLPREIMPQAYPYVMMIKMSVSLQDERFSQILSAEEEILKLVKKYPNSFTLGNIYLILASAAASLLHTEEAKDYIRKTVEHVNYGAVMLFAQYGEWLVKPLQELAEEDERYKPIISACRKFSAIHKNATKQSYTGIFPMLTKRENDIALLAVDGFTNKQIAAQLFISENTVKSSLKNIFAKLGISSRRDLLRIAQMGTGM